MPRVKQPATNTAQEALSLTSIANEGPMFFVPQGPLTEGAVHSAIGDTDVPGVRNPAADLCTTSPPLGGDNEKTLGSSPSRIGNQLRFADLRPTKRPGGSTDNPEDLRTL